VYLVGTNTLIGLHQHTTPAPDERFSEFRVGLDHVAFGVADRDELEKWTRRLDELGIEHGEIEDAQYGSDVSFRDPDGIALEFFAPAAA
jgi:glyoxylase I family protein